MKLVEKIPAARFLLPSVGLIVLVLGSIYAGFATATEAAAVGVAGALLVMDSAAGAAGGAAGFTVGMLVAFLAYRDQFAAAFGDYETIDAKLADFDRAYAAAVKRMGQG